MKNFNNTGNINSFDITHLSGSKSDYTIIEVDGKLVYTSPTHTYVVDNMEQVGFNKTGNRYDWSSEFEPFLNYGLTMDRPFSTLAQITNVGHTGVVKLWSTLGGALTTPIEVLMNFNDGATPWFSISFDFSGSVWGDAQVGDSIINGGYNNENMIGSTVTTASNVGSFKWDGGSTGNIDMGFGTQAGFEVIGKTSWDGNYYDATYKVHTAEDIAYSNPATGLNFTAEQMTALRGFVNSLSNKTPFIAWHGDTDGQVHNGPTSPYNVAPTLESGHNIAIQDAAGNWLNMLPRAVGASNEGLMTSYTRDSFFMAKTSSGYYKGSITLPNGLYTDGLILPNKFVPTINTGGGIGFGAYSNPTVSPSVNGKTTFLIR